MSSDVARSANAAATTVAPRLIRAVAEATQPYGPFLQGQALHALEVPPALSAPFAAIGIAANMCRYPRLIPAGVPFGRFQIAGSVPRAAEQSLRRADQVAHPASFPL